MRRLIGIPLLLLAFTAATVPAAYAKDKDKKEKSEDDEDSELGKPTEAGPEADDFKEESDGTEAPPPTRLDSADKEEDDGKDDDIDFSDDGDEPDIEFKDDSEQETVKERGPGEDTAQLYRDLQKKVAEMNPDEEQIAWENYLKKYPNSLFKDRIEARMEELSNLMFGERVEGSDRGDTGQKDAAKRELNFATPLSQPAVDARTRFTAGIQLGLPNWFGGHVDAEWAILRNLSVHGGLGRGFSGGEINLGGKYALIKSTRTRTILSGGLDATVNMGPAFLAVEPVVAFGQRINVAQGLDLQLTASLPLELRAPIVPRLYGGFHAELHANETVSIFLATNLDTKYLSNDDVNTFRFYTAMLGLKFTAMKGKGVDLNNRMLIDLGASVPVAHSYWGFYRGAIDIGGEYYL